MADKNRFELTEMETRVVQMALKKVIDSGDCSKIFLDCATQLKKQFMPHSQHGYSGLCGAEYCRCSE